jgi:hypothetical protein
MSKAVLLRTTKKFQHQIRPKNTIHLILSLQLPDPDGWHAIRDDKQRSV